MAKCHKRCGKMRKLKIYNQAVIPAKAGIQTKARNRINELDSCLHRNDREGGCHGKRKKQNPYTG